MSYNLFIYCNPKCGSSTLAKTLKEYKYDIYYTHGLEYQRVFKMKEDVFDIINKSSYAIKKKFNLPILIIDVYRTPLEQAISFFFHNLQFYVDNPYEKSIEYLINTFNNNFDTIFDKVMNKQALDEVLDKYNLNKNINFDFDKGYHVWGHDNKIIIKLLFKNMSKWNNHLSQILQKNIHILPDNLSQDKKYSTLLNNFKLHYKISKANYDKLINLESFKIYNSHSDKLKYQEKWKNKIIY